MKKNVIRIAAFIILLGMVTTFSVFAGDEKKTYVFDYESSTITIPDADMSPEKAKMIADKIVYGETEQQTRGIFCIFGHDLVKTTTYSLQHVYFSAPPRCLKTNYYVEYCARDSCTYSDSYVTSTERLSCH